MPSAILTCSPTWYPQNMVISEMTQQQQLSLMFSQDISDAVRVSVREIDGIRLLVRQFKLRYLSGNIWDSNAEDLDLTVFIGEVDADANSRLHRRVKFEESIYRLLQPRLAELTKIGGFESQPTFDLAVQCVAETGRSTNSDGEVAGHWGRPAGLL